MKLANLKFQAEPLRKKAEVIALSLSMRDLSPSHEATGLFHSRVL